MKTPPPWERRRCFLASFLAHKSIVSKEIPIKNESAKNVWCEFCIKNCELPWVLFTARQVLGRVFWPLSLNCFYC